MNGSGKIKKVEYGGVSWRWPGFMYSTLVWVWSLVELWMYSRYHEGLKMSVWYYPVHSYSCDWNVFFSSELIQQEMLQDLGDFQFWKMTPLAIVRKMSSGFLYLVGMVTWVMSLQKQSNGNNGILHIRSPLHSCSNGGCTFRIAVSGPYINIFGTSFEGLFHLNTSTWLHFCS